MKFNNFCQIPVVSLLSVIALTLTTFLSNQVAAQDEIDAQTNETNNKIQLTLNPRTDCVETYTQKFLGQQIASIETGFYKVSVTSNARFNPAIPEIKKVAFFITTDDQPYGWFHAVGEGKPIYINVSGQGTEANSVRAFFIDGLCNDNVGQAKLTFRKVRRIPPICYKENC